MIRTPTFKEGLIHEQDNAGVDDAIPDDEEGRLIVRGAAIPGSAVQPSASDALMQWQ